MINNTLKPYFYRPRPQMANSGLYFNIHLGNLLDVWEGGNIIFA